MWNHAFIAVGICGSILLVIVMLLVKIRQLSQETTKHSNEKVDKQSLDDAVAIEIQIEMASNPMNQNEEKKQQKRPMHQRGNTKTDIGTNDVALPAGWKIAVDPSSDKTYYFNRELNLTSWTVPTATTGRIETDKSTKKKNARTKKQQKRPMHQRGNTKTDIGTNDVALPAGWKIAVDPSSDKTYYFNRELNLTSWTVPTATTGRIETDKSTKKKNARTKKMLRSVTKDNLNF